MANSPQAFKRARQGEKRRLHNSSLKSAMRTTVKKVVATAQAGDKEQAVAAYKEAVPALDKLANKGIIHKNKAARNKSRLSRRIQSIS